MPGQYVEELIQRVGTLATTDRWEEVGDIQCSRGYAGEELNQGMSEKWAFGCGWWVTKGRVSRGCLSHRQSMMLSTVLLLVLIDMSLLTLSPFCSTMIVMAFARRWPTLRLVPKPRGEAWFTSVLTAVITTYCAEVKPNFIKRLHCYRIRKPLVNGFSSSISRPLSPQLEELNPNPA